MTADLARLSTSLADRYRVERELGAGGMATVYLAEDVRHHRKVALKVLHPELSAVLGPERFLKEIELTASLQHPHILPLFDSGSADGQLFYVMPFVEGETLRARLDRERLLPIADAVRLAREVADALQYAHERGVIHRDIKPENILVQAGHALVADFGIALAVQHAGGQRMTQTGLSLGTPQYMAPEQALGEKNIDARADVYSLGAICYEMLVGEPPFTGPTAQAIVARLMSDEPRPLVAQRKSIPEHVEAAVLRALEKVPADRFASAAEFAAALDEGGPRSARVPTAGERAGARDELGTLRAPGTTDRALQGHRTSRWSIALGALALLGTAAAVWGWLRPTAAPEVVRYRIDIDSVPAVKDWWGEVAISPDGATIVRSGGPNGALLVRRRDELAFSPIPGTEGASDPFFSPDGARLGYFVNGSIVAMPIAGGPPAVIADSMPTPDAVTWGSDGYLYRSMLRDGAEVIGRSEPRVGAPLIPVTTVDTAAGELTQRHPELLPDGKTLLVQVGYRDGKRAIAAADVATGKHTVLVEGIRGRYARSGHLLYTTNDGKLWAVPFEAKHRTISGTAVQVGDRIPASIIGPVDFAVSASGTLVYSVEDVGARRELAWVTRTGARQPFDSTWKGEFSSPALSRDGSRVAVAIRGEGGQFDIWTKPVSGGVPTKLTGGQHRNNVEPAWSPDGHWVSYLSSSGSLSTGDVWRQRTDGTGAAERVLQSRRPLSEEIWAPVGNALLVRTTTPTAGSGDILVMRPGVDSIPGPLVATPRSEYSPVVSPDGKWLAYVSNETGRLDVYVAPFDSPSSAKWPVSTNGGVTPRWSHKGDELFYLDLRTNLVAARISTTPSFAVQSTRVLFNASDFIQTSVTRRNFDVAADDQRFLMVQRADNAKRGQVVVVEHWAEEMRRKARRP